MVGLVDIAVVSEDVTVGDQKVPVYGISVHGVSTMFKRFPQLQQIMATEDDVDVDVAKFLIDLGPDIVVAAIAAGTGVPGDEAAEKQARLLGLEIQADFLEAIVRLTLPKGWRPFVDRLARLGVLSTEDVSTESAKPGKKRVSKSRKRSKR